MYVEDIKSELIERCSSLKIPKTPASSDPVKDFQDNMSNIDKQTEKGAMQITEVLNEIVVEKNIEFDDVAEKDEFILEMKSTIEDVLHELVRRSM